MEVELKKRVSDFKLSHTSLERLGRDREWVVHFASPNNSWSTLEQGTQLPIAPVVLFSGQQFVWEYSCLERSTGILNTLFVICLLTPAQTLVAKLATLQALRWL